MIAAARQTWIARFFLEGKVVIARNKNQNTFAKRQREQDKRRKAEDKLKRRTDRKTVAGSLDSSQQAASRPGDSTNRDEAPGPLRSPG